MLTPFANQTYARLFAAQILSLLGTGLMTVAPGLLAFDLAGAHAGAVLGTALAIKMVADVGIAPIAGAFVHLVPRRSLLVALDLVRAAAGMAPTFLAHAAIAAGGLAMAAWLWPAAEDQPVAHVHRDLPAAQPHLAGAEVLTTGGFRHAHLPVADTRHAMRGG